jgi:hypothetical protein
MSIVGANALAIAANSKVSTPNIDYEIKFYFTNNIP